jgi:ubiquinone/menaquinone biosynthesis C-methylase UbiE
VSRLALLGTGAVVAVALWWRRHPSACPYGQRFWVEAPHPLITRERLRRVLAPRGGEHVLEVGPGTGYYSLALAEWLGPDGRLALFDLQQEMLDHTLRRAGELASRMTATQGDATALPYADETFDAAVLTCTLGEIADQDAALRELARVLKPDGRLIVGELMGDPHVVLPGALERAAESAGLQLVRRDGTLLGYFAELRRADPVGVRAGRRAT